MPTKPSPNEIMSDAVALVRTRGLRMSAVLLVVAPVLAALGYGAYAVSGLVLLDAVGKISIEPAATALTEPLRLLQWTAATSLFVTLIVAIGQAALLRAATVEEPFLAHISRSLASLRRSVPVLLPISFASLLLASVGLVAAVGQESMPVLAGSAALILVALVLGTSLGVTAVTQSALNSEPVDVLDRFRSQPVVILRVVLAVLACLVLLEFGLTKVPSIQLYLAPLALGLWIFASGCWVCLHRAIGGTVDVPATAAEAPAEAATVVADEPAAEHPAPQPAPVLPMPAAVVAPQVLQGVAEAGQSLGGWIQLGGDGIVVAELATNPPAALTVYAANPQQQWFGVPIGQPGQPLPVQLGAGWWYLHVANAHPTPVAFSLVLRPFVQPAAQAA